jgi:hypothetical protein
MFNWVLIFGIDRFAIGVPAPREALWTIESVDGGLQVRHTQTNAVLPEPRDWTVDDLAESLFTTLRITEQNEMVIAVDSALAPRLDAALRARVGKRGFGA